MIKRLLLLCLVAIRFSITAYASHVAGGTISVQSTGNIDEYILRLELYRDCAGMWAPGSVVISYSDSSGNAYYTATLFQVAQQVSPITVCAPLNPISCPIGLGYEIYTYETTIYLYPAKWSFLFSECCRSNACINLQLGNSSGYVIEATLDNLNFPNNSTPRFSNLPHFYSCLGVPSLLYHYSIEPDGDSIAYELVAPLTGWTSSIAPPSYTSGFSPTAFISSSTPVNLDAASGTISFTATAQGGFVYAIKANEYRNGVLSSTVMNDILTLVVPGISNPCKIDGTVFYDVNANNVLDTGETGISGIKVESSSLSYAFTNQNGDYAIYTSSGQQWVAVVDTPPVVYTISPSQIQLNNLSIATVSTGNNFAVTLVPGIADISIHTVPLTGLIIGNMATFQVCINNIGSVTLSGNLYYQYDSLLSYTSSSVLPFNSSGQLLSYAIPAIGPFQSYCFTINFIVSPYANLDDLTCVHPYFIVTSGFIEVDTLNNNQEACLSIQASYDPNNKLTANENGIDVNQLAHANIYYTINFQNTGNAPAQKVILEDELSFNLLPQTIHVLAASHPYNLTLELPRTLIFTFDTINLPDVNSNPQGSEGFVVFKIKPFPTLQPGDAIVNKAEIYFDYNAPVITNSTIVRINFPNAIDDLPHHNHFLIYPNPASSSFELLIPEKMPSYAEVEVYDNMQRLVFENHLSIANGRTTINAPNLKPGFYGVILRTEQSTSFSKLIIE